MSCKCAMQVRVALWPRSTGVVRAAAVMCMLYVYCCADSRRCGDSHVCRIGLIRTSEREHGSRSALNDSYTPNICKVVMARFIQSRAPTGR